MGTITTGKRKKKEKKMGFGVSEVTTPFHFTGTFKRNVKEIIGEKIELMKNLRVFLCKREVEGQADQTEELRRYKNGMSRGRK